MGHDDPRLSYVIPAYNESARIIATLEAAVAHLAENGLTGEIIVVDDGSADPTAQVVSNYARTHPQVTLLENGVNRGKGYSVRRGALRAKGQIILFSDADGSTPLSETPKLLAPLHAGEADVAIASRELPGSQLERPQPWRRRFMGGAFRWLVRLIAIGGYRDTQCGFKAFRREAAQAIFTRQTLDGFAFDVELLFIAHRLGYRVAEVPVRWIDSLESRVNPLRDSIRMFRDLFRIRIRALRGTYRLAQDGGAERGPGTAEGADS